MTQTRTDGCDGSCLSRSATLGCLPCSGMDTFLEEDYVINNLFKLTTLIKSIDGKVKLKLGTKIVFKVQRQI